MYSCQSEYPPEKSRMIKERNFYKKNALFLSFMVFFYFSIDISNKYFSKQNSEVYTVDI